MAGQSGAAIAPTPTKGAPQTVAPHTRITVAFPFSHISMAEPPPEVEEVIELLEEMADLVAKAVPGPKAEELRKRVHELVKRAA